MADVDPRNLRKGSVLQHRYGGRVMLDRRKEDDSGWWNTDGSGLADDVITQDDWTVELVADEQDPEYLQGALAVVAKATGGDLAATVLAALDEAGWRLITAEDHEKMVNAYVVQALR